MAREEPREDKVQAVEEIKSRFDEADAVFITEFSGLTVSEVEKNMGLRALPTVSLELEQVEVPASARLGGTAGCGPGGEHPGARAFHW